VPGSCAPMEPRSERDRRPLAKVAVLVKDYNGSIRIGMTVREHIPDLKNGGGSIEGGCFLCKETDGWSLLLWLKLCVVFGRSLKSDFPDHSSFLLVLLYPNSACLLFWCEGIALRSWTLLLPPCDWTRE
jgi:hypothetical protein